ncbi:hypothetical protein GWI33_001477 [Rhynchophorus ferrugineus]|uniref:Uncharacterized protein n=1 Tax=Rhynchophorus ferrugineus TaxID=354439 RepID=A0A834INF6_RHYFE|nr:hypothetical protein GWI33_001477 [Rhynchophorus ferrugineus]
MSERKRSEKFQLTSKVRFDWPLPLILCSGDDPKFLVIVGRDRVSPFAPYAPVSPSDVESWIVTEPETEKKTTITNEECHRVKDYPGKSFKYFRKLKNGDTDESAEDVTFQASRGWFEILKNRFNLDNSKIKGEAASANEAASKEYPNILNGIIAMGGYKPEEVLNVPLENDADVERSAKVSRGINSAISYYKSLKNEIDKKVRQTTLDNFLKPGPSLPSKNDINNDLQVTISSSSSD